MDADFQTKLNNLIAASGGRVWLVSGDRSTEEQTALWNAAVAQYGEADAPNWVAPPGHSNHEKGIAADLGGDIAYAHELAPKFGLWFPMDWEPWHTEPIGSRSQASPYAYTTTPIGQIPPSSKQSPNSIKDVLASLFGGPDPINLAVQSLINPTKTSVSQPQLDPNRATAPVYTSSAGGPDGIDKFMAAIKSHESSGNYSAEGVSTPWGTATGAYQFLDGTWNGYGGYARAKDAPPAIQDAKARELMQQYYNQFGNWDDVAAAWYAGPAGNFQSREVQDYVAAVRGEMG